MDREQTRREGIEDADDTGLVSGEELITAAETMLPLQPEFPRERLHAALPHGHEAHAAIDRLHAEIGAAAPNAGAIEGHVHRLRSLPELEATIANWWDDPQTQLFIRDIGQIGL